MSLSIPRFMGKIGWGAPTLITIDLGLIIEVPNPVKLAILGVVKAILPTEDKAILKLQVNFLGVIDFGKKQLSFDATIYDSRLLTFSLAGDMAMRLSWGSNSNFLMRLLMANGSHVIILIGQVRLPI